MLRYREIVCGLSSGILPSTIRRPKDTSTPSKPIRFARGSASGFAASFRFQSVTPIVNFPPAPAPGGKGHGLDPPAACHVCHASLPYHFSFKLASHFSVEDVISSQVTTPPRYAAVRPRMPVRLLSTAAAALLIGFPVRMLSTKFWTLVMHPPVKVSSFCVPVQAPSSSS